MAQDTAMPKSGTATDMSLWVIPGAVLGTYLLTRLPVGFLSGLTVGFAAGWLCRAERDRTGASSGREWLSSHQPQTSGSIPLDEKIDEMSEDSFPASDAPSYTATRSGKPRGGRRSS